MRNKHPGLCYRCGVWCEAGDGHFERLGSGWRVQHAKCAIEHRGKPDPEREKLNARNRLAKAMGTGKAAQRAREQHRRAIEGMEF